MGEIEGDFDVFAGCHVFDEIERLEDDVDVF